MSDIAPNVPAPLVPGSKMTMRDFFRCEARIRAQRSRLPDPEAVQICGRSLRQIRDEEGWRMYRHASFEEYLAKDWFGWTLAEAQALIAAVEGEVEKEAVIPEEDAANLRAAGYDPEQVVKDLQKVALRPEETMLALDAPTMTVAELEECETTIREGIQTFTEVGLALLDIRDRRGYKHRGYATFEAYVKEQWGWTRQRGYQLMEQAQVVQSLTAGEKMSTAVDISGKAARELARLKTPAPDGDDGRRKKLDLEAAQQAYRVATKLHGEIPPTNGIREVVDVLQEMDEPPSDEDLRAAVVTRREAQPPPGFRPCPKPAHRPKPRRGTAKDVDERERLQLRLLKVADVLRRRARFLAHQPWDANIAPVMSAEADILRAIAEYAQYEAVDMVLEPLLYED